MLGCISAALLACSLALLFVGTRPTCPDAASLVLSAEAPETLRPPVFGDFADAAHYQAAVSKFRECGTWATD